MNLISAQNIGTVHNRLTVLDVHMSKTGHTRWLCRCECGTTKDISAKHVVSAKTRSCGCLRADAGKMKRTHFLTGNREYRAWAHAKSRCYNPNVPAFYRYGGRGVIMCERWKNSFEAFLEDMGKCPDGLTLDRIDNNGNYEPGNCRWIDMKTQSENRRSTRWIEFQGVTRTMSEWARFLGVKREALAYRLDQGWPTEKALFKPFTMTPSS